MNKIYKVIWSDVRKCYVVVAEIARNRGKNNVRTIVEGLAAHGVRIAQQLFHVVKQTPTMGGLSDYPRTAAQWIVPLMVAGCMLQPVSAWASQITDKDGNSLVNGSGVHNIYAQKLVQNSNVDLAVNRFKDYKITQGDIANMYFSLSRTGDDAANLVNLVQNKIDVQGTVNAIKGNKIGGNLYFISPKGMTVGPTGVINAGRFVALAPTSDYFDELQDDEKLAYQFHHDIANFSKRDGGTFTAMEDMELNSDAAIDIQGKINTRSGIVLGANKITVANGAVLQSQKDLDFTGLVNAKDANGNVLTNATFDVGTVTMNPAADDSGDIILRSTANNKYENAPTKPLAELENIIMETSNTATVEVNGKIESDGVVELYAEATTTFDNTTWNGWNVSEIGSSLAAQLGFNWEADWVDKTNTAKVTLGETGSVRAGRIASLQANAGINVQIVAATNGAKVPTTTEAIPVIAVSVAKVENKALVDVAGDLNSGGNISLSASGGIRTNMITRAAANVVNDHDKGNQIVTGITWVTGDSISQVNIQDKKDDQGNSLNNSAITAGGDFSVRTGSNSDMTLVTTVEGMDETFASTAISVLDYDSASNVNIGRSVEAKSIKVDAENNVARVDITADNSNGEGGGANVKWMITGRRNADTIAGLLKNKLKVKSLTSGGKLSGLEDAFKTAQEYVTAGAGIAVVDSSHMAHVSVAPGVTLKATGPATVVTGEDVKPGGDVSLSAYTHVDRLHHYAAGEANKVDRDTQSKVTVAAGVLYSSIEDDATVELQSDTENHQGVTLESENGSVNLASKTVQIYDPLEIFKTIDDRLKLLEKMLKDLGHECEELTNLHAETVTTKTQLENGSISEAEATASVLSYAETFTDFVSKEGNNLIQLDKGIQVLLDDIGAIFGPESYTNYYVRSYTVTNGANGKNVALGASLNIAELYNKSIVSIGENASINAGKDIRINTTTDTNVVSFTGNGGQYLALSESNGSGLGASVAVQDFSGDSIILSGKNVTMNAKGSTDDGGNIALNTDNEMIQTAIILSAGKADSNLSVSGSVNVLTGDSNSLILVDDETVMTALGNVTISANNDTTVTNIAGGLALGSSKTNASVGAGAAVNYLGVNSMAVIGDNGTDASVTDSGTGTDTTEEENKKKAQKTLDAARKLAKERATVKKMDTDFELSDKKLNESMGTKTAGTAKGSVSAKNVYVTGNSDGTINSVALEGASNSENHSAFDTFDKWSKKGAAAQNQTTTAMKNIVAAPLNAADKLFDKSHIGVDKTFNFNNVDAIQSPNNDASTSSFNAAAAASVSWNKINSDTTGLIDNVSLDLGETTSGKLLNAASDDVFIGAWSGAAAVNWFTGGTGSQANQNAHKGALGAALAVNNLEQDVKAVISNSTITKSDIVENTAIKDGAEVAAALGIAVTNDSHGTGTNASVTFGLSLNKTDSDIHALMIDNTSTNTNSSGTTFNNRAYGGDIQVAGGVDFSFANSANGGRAIAAGITAAVSEIENNIQSGIQGGTYTGVKDMKVAGEEAFTQVNAAVAIGVTTSEKGFTGTGSLAYADLDNKNHGYISGTNEIKATGEVSVTDRDISGSGNVYEEYLKQREEDPTGESYLSEETMEKLGVGEEAGSAIVNVAVGISASKNSTVGAAITIGDVDNKFSSDITNNKKLEADAVKAAADVHSNIVSVAAGVSVSTSNFGGAGSLSFNDLKQDNIVSISGNRTVTTNGGTNGETVTEGITANTVSGTAKNTSHIVNVTGDFAGGKNAVGLGIAYNRMDDTTGVYAANNRIAAKTEAEGVAVSLDADNDAYALALSVGAAATYKDNGLVAVHGNFGVNRGHNDTIVVMGEDKDGIQGSEQIVNASSVKANAKDGTSKTAIAGSGELALKDTTVALGIGVALTESDTADTENGDGKETLRAEINNADIATVKKNGTAAVISATTKDESEATTVAVGVGFSKKSIIAADGIGADANIYKTNSAGLKDTTIDKNDTTRGALVTVKAETASNLDTGAAAGQLTLADSLITGIVAVGVNRIKDTTSAGVTYTNKQASTSMNVGNLDISASSNGEILSVAAGADGTFKGIAAVGGSGSYNYIENNAEASIVNADVNSTGNVGVVARSDEAISNYAGVVSVAAGNSKIAAAIGVTGSNNKISGKTTALIDNSKVVAQGSENNKIKTKSKMNDSYLIDGAVTDNTWSAGSLKSGRREEGKTGVVVDASATHSIASVMANGGVAFSGDGISVDVAGVINLNDIGGSTTAKILDSQVNTEDTRSDVNVHAADYTNLAEFSGAVSVGIGNQAAVAAGVTVNVNDISRVTTAGVSTSSATWDDTEKRYVIPDTDTSRTKNSIYAENFTVTADAKQAMSSFNVAGALSASQDFTFDTGDNIVINDMKSSTIALVTNATVDYTDNAKVEASHEDSIYNMNIDAGLSLALNFEQGMAGSLNIGVGLVDEASTVTADVKNSALKKAESSSSTSGSSAATLSIGANNKTTMDATLVSVGAAIGIFSVGIASSIAVNNIDTRVTSRIVGSELTADTLTINTGNEIKITDATGTGGGGLIAGVGVGVEVNTLSETVSTIVDNSKLTVTDTLTVNTGTQRDVASTVAGVGIGAGGVSVNVLAVAVNEGIEDLGYAEDADGNSTSFNHTETIDLVLDTVNINNDNDYSEYFYGMTEDEKKEMKEKTKTDIKAKRTVQGGTGVHTYVKNASELQAANALTVQNTEKNDADLNGGSGSLAGLAVNVADVVYHLNGLNDISVKDSTVTGGSVSLTTHQGNKTANDDEAIMVQTVQAGLGGLAIGVGYAGLTTKGNTGITIDHGTLAATNGDLTVKSSDDVRSKSNMIGVSAGSIVIPVSVAHNTNKANNFVTVKGGSMLTAATTSTQVVTDSEGDTANDSEENQATEKVPAYINLLTERSGRVAAKTIGVGVGAAAIVVNTAKVYDKSTSAVSVEGSDTVSDTSSDKNSNTFTADAIRLEAVNAPVVRAEAGGTGVSLLGVSVMQSNAEAYSSATVDVKDDNSLLGDAVLAQAVIGKEETDMTHAETHGTNVSVAIGVNPNKAKAITETTASVNMGKETYKTEETVTQQTDVNGTPMTDKDGKPVTVTEKTAATSLALITQNNASRRAILGNTTIGLVASIGTGDAKATGDDKSLITAKGGSGDDAVKLQNLKLAASGSNTAKGYADGDSGGITAWGASATITMKTKTTNTTSLSGAWDVTENADIGALQQVTSKGSSKTGAGGVLSVTWANSDNNVEMDTRTELKDGAVLNARQSYVTAANKIVTGAYDGEKWNNHMDVGGVIQIAPDIKTEQKVTSKTDVAIGSNAKVTTSKGQVYDAYSDMDVWNKVEGKGGGVAENVTVYSDNVVTSTNKITVDTGAELKQEGAFETGSDITLSSSDKLKMDVVAEAFTGGVEGVLIAEVDNDITRNNSVEVDGKLTSTHDINLYAGVDTDGSSSVVDITALAEAHNNTFLSFYTNAEIDQDLKNNQQVKVGSSGSAISVRNINVSAENGSETFRKNTVEVLNLLYDPVENNKTVTNTPGESDIKETNNNYVNVDGLLKTGIQNNVAVTITGSKIPSAKDAAGNQITLTPTDNLPLDNLNVEIFSENNENKLISVDDIVVGEMDYATQLGTQLAAVEKLIQEYSTGQGGDLASYLGYIQQKERILQEMDDRGLYKIEENGRKVYTTSGYTIGYVEIPEISVSGGSIIVQSDTLYGSGELKANGKPRVTITNESDTYLRVKGIQVGDEGGDIRFRGTSVASNDDISSLNKDEKAATFTNLKNDTASAAVSAVTITGENKVSTANNTRVLTYTEGTQTNEITYTAIPDIAIVGEIRNGVGDVIIENRSYHGNITIGSDSAGKGVTVNGKTVQLIASTGSVAQDYVDGIVNIGGNPEYLNSSTAELYKNLAADSMYDKSNGYLEDYDSYSIVTGESGKANQSPDDKGTIAGDSVYIAAADININGLIQSGYSRYIADISEDALSEENIQRYKNNGSEVTVQGRTMYKVNDGRKAVYNSNLGAYEYVVQVYYDPQTGGLVVEDIDTNGGKIYLSGRISSTGNGRVLAMDGGADISITNRTSANLATGKILNNDIEGKVTIADVAKNTWTEYTRSAIKSLSMTDYLASLENPNAQVNMATTEIAESDRYAADGGKKTTAYQAQAGQRYYWTMGTESGTTTYYHKKQNTMLWGGIDLGSNTSKLEELEVSSNQTYQSDSEQRSLLEGTFIQQGTSTQEFDLNYQNRHTASDRTVTGSWKESGNWWALWSDPVYHTTWTTKEGATQSYTFSLKADNQIDVGFIGKKDGSINVANTNTAGGDINLNGNILSNTKDATLTVSSAGGNIIQKGGTTITTGHADLQAKDNIENIHIATMGEWIATTTLNDNGEEIDISTTNDRVNLSAVSYNSGNIDVDVVGGTADGKKLHGNAVIYKLASKGQQGSSSIPGVVSLKAEGNITQFASLGQMFSKSGAAAGSTYASATEFLGNDEGYQQLLRSNADYVNTIKNQFANRANDPDLTRKFEGFTSPEAYLAKDSEYQNMVSNASDYKKTVEDEFARYTELKQKFTDAQSGTIYANVDAYLAKDADYQNLTGIKKQMYAEKIEQEFALVSVEDTATVRGRNIRLTSTTGSIGTFKKDGSPDRAVFVDSVSEIFGLSEDVAGVSADAQKHIYLAEKDGDMRVGTIISREGDVHLGATDGRLLDSLPQQDNGNNIDENDVIHHWIDSGLIAGTADYEGAYIKGLKQDAANYAEQVEGQFEQFSLCNQFTKADGSFYTSAEEYLAADTTYQALPDSDKAAYAADIEQKYNQFKAVGPEISLRKQFTKEDGTLYTSVEEYLAADATYQALPDSNSKAVYAAEIGAAFTQVTADESLRQKFFNTETNTYYTSADEYLNADTYYQDLVKATQVKTTPYVREVNDNFNAFKKGDETYKAMFTKADGTTYDTVSQFLLEDNSEGGYLEMVAEQNAYEVAVCDEFSRFSTSKSNGQLTDMFTKADGTTYNSAAEYLQDSATYQSLVDKYTNPEYAWTKEQLLYAIRNAIVNKESGESAETQSKVANVQGKNVTLVAKGIGLNTNVETVIKASELVDGTDAAIAKMKQLSEADAADVTMKDKNDNTLLFTVVDGKQVATAYDADGNLTETDGVIDKFVIGNLSPLGVYATGQLNVTAIEDNAFVAGRSNETAGFAPVRVGLITAGGHDVRLYTQEGIYNVVETQDESNPGNIHAKDLIAYGGTEDIGTQTKPLTVSLSGDLLTANADKNVYIENAKAGDLLRVGSVYAGDTIHLESDAGFAMTENADYRQGYLNAGKQLDLITDPDTGVIGTAVNPIRILNNPGKPEDYSGTEANNGMLINLESKDAYVKGVNGTLGENTTMRLGLIEMVGDFTATSESYLEAGSIRLGDTTQYGINGKIDAGGDVVLEAVKDVAVNGPVKSTDGNITINAGSEARISDKVNGVYANTGAISIIAGTDAEIDGKVVARTGDISISAEQFAMINENSVVTIGSNTTESYERKITISGKEGVTLNSTVKAGELTVTNPDEVAEGAVPVYDGGGAVYLTSEKGSIVQAEHGVLTAASVTTTSGKAIVLTNEEHRFRNYTANGVERDKTDEQGNVITDNNGNAVKETAIDGNVTVYVHAGSNLNAAVNDTVYGDVELKNLDEGTLTVTSNITAKAGKEGQAGSITLTQQGDILVQGNLTADGTVTEQATGVGSVTNQNAVKAAQDVHVETVSGNITLNGEETAGNDLTVSSKNGNINIYGSAHAGNDLSVRTAYEGTETTQGIIWLGDPETADNDVLVSAGKDIVLQTKNGSILNNSVAIQAKEDVQAETVNGNIVVLNGATVKAVAGKVELTSRQSDPEGPLGNTLGNIQVYGSVVAGTDAKLSATNGDIAVTGDVIGGNGVAAKVLDGTTGNISLGGKVEAQKGDVVASNETTGTISMGGEVIADHDVNVTSTEGDITLAGDAKAGNDMHVETVGGNIALNGEETAGNDLTVSSKNGNINIYGSAHAGNDLSVRTAYEGTETTKGIIWLGDPETADNDVLVSAGKDIVLQTKNGSILNNSVAIQAKEDVQAETVNGNIVVLNGATVKAVAGKVELTSRQSDPEGPLGNTLGNIQVYGSVVAGTDAKLSATNGDIAVTGDVIGGNGVAAKVLDGTTGNISLGGKVEAQKGDVVASNETTGTISMGGEVIAAHDVNVTSDEGKITLDGDVKAKHDVKLTNISGDTELRKKVSAGNDVLISSETGEIQSHEIVTAGNDVKVATESGKISMDGVIEAGNDVAASSQTGNILLLGDIDAGQDVKAKTGGNGGIMLNNPLNPVYGEGTGDVHAGRNVTLETENTGLLVAGKVTTDTGDVIAVTKKGVLGFLGNVDAGRNVEASITEGDAGSVIRYEGTTRAGNDVKATTPQGDIGYYNEVYAGGSVTAKTGVGDVEYNGNVVAIDNVRADVLAGDITVGENVITRNGAITLTTADGFVEVGEDDGSGHIMAGGDVSIDTKKGGYVDVKTNIGSAHGSVSVKSGEGYIHIGNNDSDTDTVMANKNVTLEVANGKITVDGKTSTEEGDITLKAANKEYVEGEAGKNIIINHTGKVESAGNANLIAVNGDLHVTDNVEAASTLNAETRGQGDISLDQNVTVVKDMVMQADKGDITVGKDITAEKGTVTINAKSGSVAVGTIDGSGNKSGKIEAGGNVTIKAAQPAAGDRNLVDVVTSVESKGADVSIKTVNGNIHIGSNDANTETVTAKNDVNLEAVEGKIIIDGKTSTLEGDITLKATNNEYEDGADNQNIIINQSGVVDSGGDANLITANGDLQVTDNVKAEGSVNAQTHGKGNISLGQNVNVKNDMALETQDGNITVGKNITANQGSVTLTTGTGSITVGVDDGSGQKSGIIESSGDVNINAGIGNVDIETSVESKAADVNVNVADGNIHIGNNGPKVNTVTAKEDVTLETNKGKITVDGMTSTEEGDITLKAASENYTEGTAGQNIIINNDGINHNGVVKSGNDATLITKNSDLVVTDDVTANGALNTETQGKGNISLAKDVTVDKDITLQTDEGNIDVGKKVTSDNGSVVLTTGTGKITIGEDVKAGHNVSVTTGTGNVTVGSDVTGNGSVTADKDVVVNVGEGDVDIVKSVASTEGSVDISTQDGNIHIGNNGRDEKTVTAKKDVTLETEKGKITVDGMTSTDKGDITLKAASENYTEGAAGQNIIINNDGITHNGVVKSGNDVTLITKNSDLLVTDDVKANGALNTETQGKGNISLAKDVTAIKDMNLQTDEGNIVVDKSLKAGGDIVVSTVSGNIEIATNEGYVESKDSSVNISTQKGNITIGSNGPDVKTVTAKENISLITEEGKIYVQGKSSTESGDITLKASNKEYVAGIDGQNIIIEHDGLIDSAQDVTLITKNGDLHVTDDVKAGRNLNAITQTKGDVLLDHDINVKGSANLKTDTGDIEGLNGVKMNVKAGNRIVAATGDGDITIGTADAKYVALTSGGEDGHVNADTVLAQASGNSNGTGLEDVKLGGSYVNVNTVVNNSNGSTPLTISTLGGAADKPVKDINIGVQVADGVYTGGIESPSGAVIQELWADRGMLYIKNDTNLHVSKVVVNEKLHVANDNISVAVFGIPPYHDGARMVYWNDADAKNPSSRLGRWFNRSYSDPDWMYLDLFGNGDVGSRYGVLMDAHWYRNIYGDSVSMVDTIRIRTDFKPLKNDIALFDRFDLLDYQEVFKAGSAITDAQEGEIEIETEEK